jgi:hypothetical protein
MHRTQVRACNLYASADLFPDTVRQQRLPSSKDEEKLLREELTGISLGINQALGEKRRSNRAKSQVGIRGARQSEKLCANYGAIQYKYLGSSYSSALLPSYLYLSSSWPDMRMDPLLPLGPRYMPGVSVASGC